MEKLASSKQVKSWREDGLGEGTGTGSPWLGVLQASLFPNQHCLVHPAAWLCETRIPALPKLDEIQFLSFATKRDTMLELSTVPGKQKLLFKHQLLILLLLSFPYSFLSFLLCFLPSLGKWGRETENRAEERAPVPSSHSLPFLPPSVVL